MTTTVFGPEVAVIVDLDLHRRDREMRVAYSNKATTGSGTVQVIPQACFYDGGQLRDTSDAAALYVELGPSEVQVLVPE